MEAMPKAERSSAWTPAEIARQEWTSRARAERVLVEIKAEHVGISDFAPDEFPYDPTDPQELAEGANFRLDTDLGPLNIMQWVAGIQADIAYPELASRATNVHFRDTEIHVYGLEHLRAMKRAAAVRRTSKTSSASPASEI
jgi:hypothetical protein